MIFLLFFKLGGGLQLVGHMRLTDMITICGHSRFTATLEGALVLPVRSFGGRAHGTVCVERPSLTSAMRTHRVPQVRRIHQCIYRVRTTQKRLALCERGIDVAKTEGGEPHLSPTFFFTACTVAPPWRPGGPSRSSVWAPRALVVVARAKAAAAAATHFARVALAEAVGWPTQRRLPF
jgi:hypothetical protein